MPVIVSDCTRRTLSHWWKGTPFFSLWVQQNANESACCCGPVVGLKLSHRPCGVTHTRWGGMAEWVSVLSACSRVGLFFTLSNAHCERNLVQCFDGTDSRCMSVRVCLLFCGGGRPVVSCVKGATWWAVLMMRITAGCPQWIVGGLLPILCHTSYEL